MVGVMSADLLYKKLPLVSRLPFRSLQVVSFKLSALSTVYTEASSVLLSTMLNRLTP